MLALLVGVLIGGSGIWFLKPTGQGGVVEKVVNKYVCYDGAVKDAQSECPVVKIEGGQQTLECPKCPATGSTQTTTQCSCDRLLAQCGGIIPGYTTTTIHVPVCKSCTTNGDCGSPTYSEPRCKNDQTYKMYIEPFCDMRNESNKCCLQKETPSDMTQCPEGQRCVKGQGCAIYEDAT